MPLTKVDYSKTTIYKIQHKEIDELLYVGSTTDFTRRKAEHKRLCNNANSKHHNLKVYQMMRDNGGFDCFNIIVIKDFPCNTKQEALIEEDRCMREMKVSMNSKKAYTTPEERREYLKMYREVNIKKMKQYYDDNRYRIIERVKQYRNEHREQIAERRQKNYEMNKSKILEENKQKYERNKEQILERRKNKITCDCGCVIRRDGLSEHKRSKKHKNYLNSQ